MGSIFREPRRHEETNGVEGGGHAPPLTRRLLLRHCLAIQLQRRRKGAVPGGEAKGVPSNETSEFWMYDSGYLLFQSFLEANLKCFWNPALREAVRGLEFRGYVHPGVLLVASPSAGDACLDRIRNAWTRNVLKPPADHSISAIGDVDELAMVPVCRGSFTPLPEALCWVVLELTSAGEAASLPAVRAALSVHFPGIKSPSESVIYDALAALMVDGKVYQTANGYFVVTPESKRRSTVGIVTSECPSPAPSPVRRHQSRRSGSSPSHRGRPSGSTSGGSTLSSSASRLPHSCLETSLNGPTPTPSSRHVLLSPDEAMTRVHGEMETVRVGHITHQAVQTNLADVICGGNSNDKVLYGRSKPSVVNRWGSSLGRRRSSSLRLFGAKRRATSASSLVGTPRSPSPPPPTADAHRHRRSASLRLYPSSCASSSLSYSSSSSSSSSASPSPVCPPDGQQPNKKGSLLSRLFRRGGSLSWRQKRNGDGGHNNASGTSLLPTFSAQFPPLEWFNPSVAHLHSVATQTRGPETATSSPTSSPITRPKLARSQGSLPSLSQRTSATETVLPPPSSSSSTALSRRASTLPRPRHRHRSGGSAPLQVVPKKESHQRPALEVSTSIPNTSPSITSSSRRSLASITAPPSISAPSTTTNSSRSPRHSGGWPPKGTSVSSKGITPASSTSGGSSTGSREAEKAQATSKLPSPPLAGKGSILTLQVSSRSSPGSNYSLSFNGGGPSSLPSFNSHFGTRTTTTMTTSATVTSPAEHQLNGINGGIKSRTEVSVESRQVTEPGPEGSTVSSSPVKSVVRVEGEGSHLVVLNNVGGVPKKAEKVIDSKSHPSSESTSKAGEEKGKQPALTELIPPKNGLQKMRHSAPEERIKEERLMVENIREEQPINKDKSLSEDSVVEGGSSDTSVGTGPFESSLTLMEFKSLAAQRILKGLSANSIDTLVEVNMAAAARKADGSDVLLPQGVSTNYDVTVHTDFGMV